jgi:hypothetical protein
MAGILESGLQGSVDHAAPRIAKALFCALDLS